MFKWYWRFQTQGSSLWSRVIKALYGETGNVNASSGLKTSWTNIVKEVNFLASKGIDLRTPICFKLGNGEKARFWEDRWFDGVPLKTRFPRVYALESCKDITVASKTSHLNFASSLHRWTWNLSSSGEFSVSSVRCLIDDKTLPVFDHQTRWVRFVPIKVNVIAWKVKNNSLPTRFNISRRGISINCIKCAICDIGVETVNHLFFSCELVTQLVKMIVRWWSVPYLEIDSYADWVSWMDNLHLPIKNKLMLEGVFYVMWCSRSKEDEVQRISTSVFVTNFPEVFSAKDLWNTCKQYGQVVDAYIPNKRSKAGKRFGFVRFVKVFDTERLVNNLCTVWVGRHKLHANIPRFQREPLNKHSNLHNNFGEKRGSSGVGNNKNGGLTNPKGFMVFDQVRKANGNFDRHPSYVGVVKHKMMSQQTRDDDNKPSIVLDDSCVFQCDYSLSLTGKVLDFGSLSNLKMILTKEGFENFNLKYLGGFWVLIEFCSKQALENFKSHVGVVVGSSKSNKFIYV
ncbi:RNA-directed DNA polymerase, eukaryota [Tanacetum coccineum]